MNLFLALLWFSCAVMLFVYELVSGGGRSHFQVGSLRVSRTQLILAATLMMTVYNLVRWRRLRRAARQRQRYLDSVRAYREADRRHRQSEPAGPPDPNFNFTEEPPPQL